MTKGVVRINGQMVRINDAHAIFNVVYPLIQSPAKGVARGHIVEGRYDIDDLSQEYMLRVFTEFCMRFPEKLPEMIRREAAGGPPLIVQMEKYCKHTGVRGIQMVGRGQTAECRDFRMTMPMGDNADAISTVGVTNPTTSRGGSWGDIKNAVGEEIDPKTGKKRKVNSLEIQKREAIRASKTVRKNKPDSCEAERLMAMQDTVRFFFNAERKMVQRVVTAAKRLALGEDVTVPDLYKMARDHGYSESHARRFRNEVAEQMKHCLDVT